MQSNVVRYWIVGSGQLTVRSDVAETVETATQWLRKTYGERLIKVKIGEDKDNDRNHNHR